MIRPMERKDYIEIYKLSNSIEPYKEYNYFDQFCQILDKRRGFTIWSENKLIGLLSYSDYFPGITVTIHFLQKPGVLNKSIVKKAFKFPFNDLLVPRLISYSIIDITDNAGHFLKRLGFRLEGTLKEAARMPNGIKDVEIYGMLKRECKWL